MQKKFTALLILTFLLSGVPSCKKESIDCTIKGEYFDINGVNIWNVKARETDFSNGRNVNPIEDGETIPFEYFIIRAIFESEYYSENQALFNFDFSNKAYALSCAVWDGYKGSKEKLDTLYLITNNNYNENFSAGDTINEIVEANVYSSYFMDIDNFLPLSDYVNKAQREIMSETFQIKLIKEPTFKDLNHSFKIIYKLKNGELYTAQTDTVSFE